jgi:hypothetical protein
MGPEVLKADKTKKLTREEKKELVDWLIISKLEDKFAFRDAGCGI